MIQQEQTNLNALYDAFEKKYKRINTRANKSVFGDDSSFCLLSIWDIWSVIPNTFTISRKIMNRKRKLGVE